MSGPREQTAAAAVEKAIWNALELQDIYVDRDMDMIDASGAGVDMAAVAAAVVEALGLTEERKDIIDPHWTDWNNKTLRTERRWVSGWSVVGGEPSDRP